MSIKWEPFLTVDGEPLRPATDQDLDEIEAYLGLSLPQDFRELVKSHQGQIPTNLEIGRPSGSKPGFSCVLHALTGDDGIPDDLESYAIDWMTEVVQDELGYRDVVVFSRKGNSIFALDFSDDTTHPSVVLIDGDCEADDPSAKTVLAETITDFFERFEKTP